MDKKYVIKHEVLVDVVKYLLSKPMAEVEGLVSVLRQSEELKEEEKEVVKKDKK